MSELFPELDAYEGLGARPVNEELELSADTRRLLDELGGRGAPSGPGAGESAAVYSEHDVRQSRPGIVAGAESIAKFERAFGLVGKLRSLKRSEGDHIEFVAEVDRAGTLACGKLSPPGERAWREGKSFSASYRGELHPLIARALLRFMARYDGLPWQLILDQLAPDPGNEHMLAHDYPESLFHAYAPADGWRRFFEGTELYRGAGGGQPGAVATIDHTDIECLFNQAPDAPYLPSFFNIPVGERPEGAAQPSARSMKIFTDIGDVDVIKGADLLVDEALDYLAQLDVRPDTVVIQAGCLPEVTGDDIEASAARTQDRLRLPVLAIGQHNDIAGISFGELLGRERPALERPLDPRGVALLGMPAFSGLGELRSLLREAGVDITLELLPEIPDRALEHLARASLLVAYPWRRYAETVARIGEHMAPARSIQPRAPFGLENSRRWLLSVAAAVDCRAQMEPAVDRLLARLRPRWDLLRARARQLRVGFVVDHPNWRAELSSERRLGLPMVEMLVEMGFGVEILAYTGERELELPGENFEPIRVRGYRSVEELDDMLAEPGVAAWYSEMNYDRRLSRNGKNSFSMRQFSMGLRGAVDSLERLLRVSTMSFYRSYGRYLGTAFCEREQGGS